MDKIATPRFVQLRTGLTEPVLVVVQVLVISHTQSSHVDWQTAWQILPPGQKTDNTVPVKAKRAILRVECVTHGQCRRQTNDYFPNQTLLPLSLD